MPTIVQAINQLDSAATALANFRARPILVMYYPPRASVTEYDINYAYKELRDGGVAKEQPLTYGGDPVAGYRVAQVLRSMYNEMDVLVPEHAYSAGTLTSFCGDEIRLGDFAGLSPIDITITEPGSDGVQLAGLDSFLQFAHEARAKSE